MQPYWQSSRGETRLTIYQGDCLEVLASLPLRTVDAVIADPPYAMAGAASNGRHELADEQFWLHWFTDVWRAVQAVARDDAHAFVFCDWRTVGAVAKAINRTSWAAQQALVWDREGNGMGSPFRNSFEMLVYARGPRAGRPPAVGTTTRNIIRFPWYYGRHEWHPAEKPVGLIEQLLDWLQPRCVLDPFLGSGTTLVAAARKRISAVGIEIDPDYCAMSQRRLEREHAQVRLPVGDVR